ncbi:MAG: hypothetical protein CTY12_00485 [Methylotenera sp.]|nr:MAG: hypothetical protein CTY12_00485 [Methylotenera sp.]
MNIIITRKQAIEQKLKYYYTGIPCKRGHIDRRLTSVSTCCTCIRENHYTYYEKHRDTALNNIKKWSAANSNKVKEASSRYRINNPTANYHNHKKWYDTNKTQKLKYNRWWRNVNKDKLQSYNAIRRSQIKQALPYWADIDKILKVYRRSVQLTKETGIIHHVDHIIPLSNELVCGLHVHYNLQVLIGTDNMSKGNKFVIC